MSDPDTPTPPGRERARRPRWLRLALIVSVMVNVLVIGVLVGGAIRHKPFAPPPGQIDMRAMWRSMPDHSRSTLREMARERGFGGERLSRDERRERAARVNGQILAALRADPFDAEGFVSLLEGDRAVVERRLDAANEAFTAHLSAMSPSERRAMAERLEDIWDDRRRDDD